MARNSPADGAEVIISVAQVQIAQNDPLKIIVFMAASTFVLALVIFAVGSIGARNRPSAWRVLATAGAISGVGILLGKYGENFGLSWVVYYTLPALATIFLPPLVFDWRLRRSAACVVLALLSAPLIHAAFFYGLGWSEYMPFLRLPPL